MEVMLPPGDAVIADLPPWLLEMISPQPLAPAEARPTPRALGGNGDRYAAAALTAECEGVRSAPEGTRNDNLNRAAFSLGQLVAAGQLDEEETQAALLDAAESAGLGERESEATIRSGLEAGRRHPRELPVSATTAPLPASKPVAARPTIQITPDVVSVVDDAQAAMVANSNVALYQRGGVLVRIVRDGARRIKGLSRPKGAPVIAAAPDAHVMELMATAARWERWNGKKKDCVDALPPNWAVKVLTARSEWPFPYLESVVETPMLRPDGTVLDQPGYDPETAVFFDPGQTAFPPIQDQPSRAAAQRALVELCKPFMEFPHVNLSDLAAVIAAILSVVARPAIAGPVPAFVFRATAPGTGKSLEADVVSILGTGRSAARTVAPKDDDESRKRILTIGLEGTPVVLIDNVERSLGSASLSAALTGDAWSDRLLGVSKTVTVCLRTVWLATGNNLTFKGDIGRRVVPIDLDAEMEHPEDRTGFTHPDLRRYVLQERPRLVSEALTLLRAFHLAGRPGHGKPPKGSFEAWDGLVRAALIWAGEEDPLGGCERIRTDGDLELDGLRQALNAWNDTLGAQALTAAAVAERSKAADGLRAALAVLIGCDAERVDARRLGYVLRKHVGRIVGGLKFERAGESRDHTTKWRVASGAGSTASLSAGDGRCAGDSSRYAREDHGEIGQ